jgi:hypothetical protein
MHILKENTPERTSKVKKIKQRKHFKRRVLHEKC